MAILGSAVLFATGCGIELTEAERVEAAKGILPKSFRSDIIAVAYLHQMPGDGHIESYKVRNREVMIAFRHGSDVPVTSIAIYRRSLFRWNLESEMKPPSGEAFTVRVSEKNLTLLGEQSQRSWPLFEFEK